MRSKKNRAMSGRGVMSGRGIMSGISAMVMLLAMVTLLTVMLVGCGAEQVLEATNELQETVPEGVTETIPEADSEDISQKNPKQIEIYYWAMMSNHAEKEEVTIEDFQEEDLQTVARVLGYLSSHNIVSVDTKVEEFYIEQTSDSVSGQSSGSASNQDSKQKSGKTLHLDLNKAFSEYLNTMGNSGEQIVLSSLVNTFLDAWDGDCIYITSNGKVLQTDHRTYEEAFVKSELNLAVDELEEDEEDIYYQIETCDLENDDTISVSALQVKYPVFTEMDNTDVQETINQKIVEYVGRFFVAEGLSAAVGDYELYEKARDIYIVFRGTTCSEQTDYETKKILTLHFDLETGSMVQLNEVMDVSQIVNQITEGDYLILSEDLDKDSFRKILEDDYPDLQESLEQFDIGKGLSSISVPPGYSFETDDGLHLIFSVSHEKGDYLEIVTKAPVLP